jgi:hypothetical protein
MHKIIKLAFIIFLALNSMGSSAEPSPFGIIINQTTLEEVKERYKFTEAGLNKYSEGEMLDLETSQLNFEGLKDIRIIFSKDNKVLGILATINKDRYQDLFNMISSKYKLIKQEGGFVGDKMAEFQSDNTQILLLAPHLSFTLKLNYIHDDLNKKFLHESERERQEKSNQEKSQL